MTRAFISYSHADDALRAELEKHMSLLRRQELVDLWSDHRIPPGGEFEKHISAELEAADVIMLLVSPDFMASEYCFGIEMKRAMERQQAGLAIVIPIILRPVDWKTAPFGTLNAVPRNGTPVVKWPTLDDAFLDVVQTLRLLLTKPEAQAVHAGSSQVMSSSPAQATVATKLLPRSGTLSLAREFTDFDRDNFLDEAFTHIQEFFGNSLDAIGERNPSAEGKLRRRSETGFTATLYRNGEKLAGCYIRISKGFGRDRSIAYSGDDSGQENSYNEMLSVEADRHNLHLKPLMAGWSGTTKNLTLEGAAERLWQLFIERLT